MKTIIRDRLPLVLSSLALVVALTAAGATASGVFVTSKQIRNGTILTQDIHKGGVKASDIANGTVGTADIGTEAVTTTDIGAGQVTPSDLTLPPPAELQEADTTALTPPTDAYSRIDVVGAYTKADPTSLLQVEWTGAVEGRNQGDTSGCIFQLRVDGQPSPDGGGEVFGRGVVSVAASALFGALPVGPHQVEVWARGVLPETATGIAGGDRCVVGPAAAGVVQTVVVSEAIS